jgi:hypothetical protein
MDKKKVGAAIAAVTAYIRTGEEAAAGMVPVPETGMTMAEKTAQTGSINLWGISGRQNIMQTRSLMQMKSFHKTKM